ncbi:hypothetical protein A0H81_13439 [Grifola frondosa]|uniref:Retrotransposon gag domain-containing protein n=1 Tax=Grifola frondosa TaxID=5627 RepID=A0A1C7LP98_GRIFR|nr:hypothetical protein A0H81_13439 [Grifola frondosa]
MPEPPTFSSTDNKLDLEGWLNQVVLYCLASGIVTDHQKIMCKDLGTWDEFVKELSAIYGKWDDKESAKEEITNLWSNKDLAKKDFIKYAEQYRTLARLVEYQDKIHIDKLRNVIPTELCNSLVMLDIAGKMPTKWEKYLELLLRTYKALHPEKTKTKIFKDNEGKGNLNSNSNGKDPNVMEIDGAKKSKQANFSESKN